VALRDGAQEILAHPVMSLAVVYGALAVFTKGSVLAPFISTIF
jgi:hypothetical protein